MASLLGFFTVFFGFVILGALIGKLLSKLFKWTGLSWLDRLMGAAFGLVRGGLIAIAMVAVLLAFASEAAAQLDDRFEVLPYAIDASDLVAALAPAAVKDAFRESMRDIQKNWEENYEEEETQARSERRVRSMIHRSSDLRPRRHSRRFQRDLADSVNATRAWRGLEPLPIETVASYVGNGAPVLIQRTFPDASDADLARLLRYFLDYYREHMLDATVLYPGVKEALDRLHEAHVPMAVLTNKPVRFS